MMFARLIDLMNPLQSENIDSHAPEAFTVLIAASIAENTKKPLPVLFASPHSGQYYPNSMLADICVPLMDLRRTEDAFVQDLYANTVNSGASLVHANYARSYVDLNRDARELDPAMFHDGPPRTVAVPSPRVEAGLGCLPRVGARGEEIYARQISQAEGEYRLSHVYDAYHGYIRNRLETLHNTFGIAILIDCHSMPSRQPRKRPLPDIVLGDRFGSSCDNRLTSLVERTFRDMRYTVSRNAPYAGGYTTRCYGRPKRGVHALQIEINRSLYMDERAVKPNDGFAKLQDDLSILGDTLAAFARRIMHEKTVSTLP